MSWTINGAINGVPHQRSSLKCEISIRRTARQLSQFIGALVRVLHTSYMYRKAAMTSASMLASHCYLIAQGP